MNNELGIMNGSHYLNLYVKFLQGFVDAKNPLRVVFDCSNGTTGLILKKLQIANCKLQIINSKPDGRFPAHGPNPSLPGALKQLSRAVKAFKADLGVAFDADGDRAFFVDENGKEVEPYFIAALLSSSHKPPFVFDIFNFEALKYSGFKPLAKVFPSRVGTYFVKQELARRRASLAVEYSGHYYFKDFFNADSGILTALKVMNALSRGAAPFSSVRKLLPVTVAVSQFNLRMREPVKLFGKLKKNYTRKAGRIDTRDGITFELKRGWLTARPSNTEPLVRFFIGGTEDFVLKKEKVIRGLVI